MNRADVHRSAVAWRRYMGVLRAGPNGQTPSDRRGIEAVPRLRRADTARSQGLPVLRLAAARAVSRSARRATRAPVAVAASAGVPVGCGLSDGRLAPPRFREQWRHRGRRERARRRAASGGVSWTALPLRRAAEATTAVCRGPVNSSPLAFLKPSSCALTDSVSYSRCGCIKMKGIARARKLEARPLSVPGSSEHRDRCRTLPPLQTGETESLVAAFLASRSVTVCPVRFAAPIEQHPQPMRRGY